MSRSAHARARTGRAAVVSGFDRSVDAWFEAHLRGRRAADVVMYTASGLGEHSFVWLVLGGLRSLRAGRGWRGFAGVAALLAGESLLVNGLVKSLFGRHRPRVADPHPLPLRTPRSSSFPSGHASAAFFSAALLGGRGPARGLYYALAVVVSASRAHVRMHHGSDVVAGAALGAALGALARRHLTLGGPPRPGDAAAVAGRSPDRTTL